MPTGWAERFSLPLDPSDTGYGHDPETVAVVTVDASSLLDYFEDVHQKTLAFVRTIDNADLDRVVDNNWDPPVTMSVRLVSVIADDLQHVGQGLRPGNRPATLKGFGAERSPVVIGAPSV